MCSVSRTVASGRLRESYPVTLLTPSRAFPSHWVPRSHRLRPPSATDTTSLRTPNTLEQNTVHCSGLPPCLERHRIPGQVTKWDQHSLLTFHRNKGTRNTSLSSEMHFQKTSSKSVMRNDKCPTGLRVGGEGGESGDLQGPRLTHRGVLSSAPGGGPGKQCGWTVT